MNNKRGKRKRKKKIDNRPLERKMLLCGAIASFILVGMAVIYFISSNKFVRLFEEKASLLWKEAETSDSYAMIAEEGIFVFDATGMELEPINPNLNFGLSADDDGQDESPMPDDNLEQTPNWTELTQQNTYHIDTENLDGYVVFFSVCDTQTRASVFSAKADSLDQAWKAAVKKTKDFIRNQQIEPLWVKADIVLSAEKVDTYSLQAIVSRYKNFLFRKGISFDQNFETAFLESEVNGNKLIDYEKDTLDFDVINKYLTAFQRNTVKALPDTLYLFDCSGYFCDENNEVYTLYGYGSNDGLDYGRRIIDEMNDTIARDVMLAGTYWLAKEINEDGSFNYGYYPTYDRKLTAYNILRHTVTVQTLMWAYEMNGDETLLPKIENTVAYLTQGNIVYRDEHTAYAIDRSNSEIKLGGNALAIIMLSQYMELFQTSQYQELCKDLGNGILSLMDMEQGAYYHVLNTDFSKKEEYRTVFYDGEATYALSILYGMTGDTKWLDAAKAAADNFIRKDYTKYKDHWVSYAMNEITKYCPEEKYFTFGLRNVQVNLESIYNKDITYHTYLELLMAAFSMYDRMMERGIQVPYLDEFNDRYFIETIFRRAEHMLNGYLYPEYAMYLKNPQRIVNTFCLRHQGYRVRIDDVEHFTAAYFHFYENYDKLVKYREKLR